MKRSISRNERGTGKSRDGCRPLLMVLLMWLGPLVGIAEQSAATRPTTTSAPTSAPAETTHHEDFIETGDLELLELEIPTVVTAARREQKIDTVPHAISVITAEDIRLSGARTVPDALRLVPGIDVAELASGASAISPRGYHALLSENTLVLVDGRQIFDSLYGGTAWASWPFMVEDIERIEVIRGPAGVTWGANAVAGVINIVTKDPADQEGITLVGKGGSRGLYEGYVGAGVIDGKLRLRVSGETHGSDGFYDAGLVPSSAGDQSCVGRATFYGVYDAGPDDTYTFSGGGSVRHGGMPAPTLSFFDSQMSETQANYLLGKWTHEIERENYFELIAYVNDFYIRAPMPSIEYRYQQIALQMAHTFKPSDAHTITWGFDTRTDMLDGSLGDPPLLTRDHVSTAIIGFYLQDEWRLAPRWTLNLGGRLDYEFYGGFEPSGRAALSYEVTDDQVLYGAVSRAFQMPALGTRFLNGSVLGGLFYFTGDRDVKTQKLWAYEAGYRARLFDQLHTNVNVFWHEYHDVATLSAVSGPPGLIASKYGNRADSSTYGVELEGRYAVTKRLTLLGNYTYERLNWRSKVPLGDKDGMSLPEHKFMVGARYAATDDLDLSGHLYYVDEVEAPQRVLPFLRQDIGSYYRLDLRAEYRFWDERALLAVGVRNLLDDRHPEGSSGFVGYSEVPRMVYGELRIRFK